MNIIGIICEYNPFHNGHIYHIQKIKEKYPDSIIILCLNGYFLERGEVSVLTKEAKTKIALQYGVDIVIELPTLFGTQSADTFSEKATFLLHALGIERLIFGSESSDIQLLESYAKKQLEKDFTLTHKKNLSYPARLNESLQEKNRIPPNDLLGISYLKTIFKNNYSITCETIKRTSDYHDTVSNNTIISASNIRHKLKRKEAISSYLPEESKNSIVPFSENKLFEYLKLKILTDPNLEKYLDVTEGLEYKLKKEIQASSNLEEFISRLKSKRYTYNRLKRMLIHILLGITKEMADNPISYIHILGFNDIGKRYLKENREKILLPTKPIKEDKVYETELIAAQIYDMLMGTNAYSFEKQNIPIFVSKKVTIIK